MSIGVHSIGLRRHRKRRRSYETLQKLYVTISADGVTCSTSDAADVPADVPPVLTLPILNEIDRNVTVGTSGSSLLAVQSRCIKKQRTQCPYPIDTPVLKRYNLSG